MLIFFSMANYMPNENDTREIENLHNIPQSETGKENVDERKSGESQLNPTVHTIEDAIRESFDRIMTSIDFDNLAIRDTITLTFSDDRTKSFEIVEKNDRNKLVGCRNVKNPKDIWYFKGNIRPGDNFHEKFSPLKPPENESPQEPRIITQVALSKHVEILKATPESVLKKLEPGFEIHFQSGVKYIVLEANDKDNVVKFVRISPNKKFEVLTHSKDQITEDADVIRKILNTSDTEMFSNTLSQDDTRSIPARLKDVRKAFDMITPGFEIYSHSGTKRIVLEMVSGQKALVDGFECLRKDLRGQYRRSFVPAPTASSDMAWCQKIVDPFGNEIFSIPKKEARDIPQRIEDVKEAFSAITPGFEIYSHSGTKRVITEIVYDKNGKLFGFSCDKEDTNGLISHGFIPAPAADGNLEWCQKIVDPFGNEIFSVPKKKMQ